MPVSSEPVQTRAVLSDAMQTVVARGLKLRAATDLPFWDSVLVSSFGSQESIRPLLRAATFHKPVVEQLSISSATCSADVLERLNQRRPSNSSLALLSSVETDDGSIAHWPMLDFHIPADGGNARLALETVSCLEAGPGALIASGQSYHFIGETPMTRESLMSFLARALLLSPIVDRSWLAHQMLERRCALRISARGQDDDAPRVVALNGLSDCRD